MADPIRLRDLQAITFDCYGTLIDWEGGARQTLRVLLTRRGLRADDQAFFAAWERAQWRHIHAAYAPYYQIVIRSFLEVAQAYALPFSRDDATAFADSIPTWPPFPDARPALTALKGHFRLGIISNIDDALLAGSLTQLGIALDLVVTAEQAKAYKPSSRPFALALERVGLPAHLIAHAAFGFEYDLAPAARLGFRTILVKRNRAIFPPEPVPDLVVANLAELATAFSRM